MPTPPKTGVATLETAVQLQQRARAQRELMRVIRRSVKDLLAAWPRPESAALALDLRDGAAEGGFGVSCKGRLLLIYPDKDFASIRFMTGAALGKPGIDRKIAVTAIWKQALIEQAARAVVRDFIADVSARY